MSKDSTEALGRIADKLAEVTDMLRSWYRANERILGDAERLAIPVQTLCLDDEWYVMDERVERLRRAERTVK